MEVTISMSWFSGVMCVCTVCVCARAKAHVSNYVRVYSLCVCARKRLNGKACTYVSLWNLDSPIFVPPPLFFAIVLARLSNSHVVIINAAVDMCLHVICMNLVMRTGMHSLIAAGRLPMPSNIPLLENLSSTPLQVSVTLFFVF